jgi:hypothetical protein
LFKHNRDFYFYLFCIVVRKFINVNSKNYVEFYAYLYKFELKIILIAVLNLLIKNKNNFKYK